MKEDERFDRRRFFREGLRQIFGKVEKAAEPLERFAKEFSKLEQPSPPPKSNTPTPPNAASGPQAPRSVTLPLVLRPPGAIPEAGFMSACTRCGDCVRACPAECIVIDPESSDLAKTAPHIIAESKPCVICDELACMNACPSGALQLMPRFSIRMGKAVWGEGKCVRGDGEDCTKCLEVCPMGTAAIELSPEGRIEIYDSCTGCGQCQFVCPTTPRAIVVIPAK